MMLEIGAGPHAFYPNTVPFITTKIFKLVKKPRTRKEQESESAFAEASAPQYSKNYGAQMKKKWPQ
jgi:hypothetical protein